MNGKLILLSSLFPACKRYTMGMGLSKRWWSWELGDFLELLGLDDVEKQWPAPSKTEKRTRHGTSFCLDNGMAYTMRKGLREAFLLWVANKHYLW